MANELYRGGPTPGSDAALAEQYRREHANDFAYMKALPERVIKGIWNTPEMEWKKMLESFKNFDANRSSVEEMIWLLHYGRTIRDAYEEFGVSEPEFVEKQIAALEKAIDGKIEGELEKKRAELALQREALRTTEERRKGVEQEMREIDAKLSARRETTAKRKR